jgi:hypothetical protein
MKYAKFGSLKNWWFRDYTLFSELKSSETGEGIAVMKCLIALSVLVDFYVQDVDVSLSDLEAITGLSRPMVLKGLNKLEALRLVSIDKSHYVNHYQILVPDEDTNWAKVPVDKVRKELRSISNRGIAPFVALKIYIALLSLRYQDKVHVKITHEKLREYTKVQPNQIRAGLDVLFSCSLIHLMPKDDRASNEYHIIGIQPRR